MRKKIPLAKLLLRAVLSASNTYKATYVAALLGTLVQAAFSVWTAWTLVAIYVRFSGSGGTGGSRGNGATTGLVVLTIFNWYWTSELIKAITFTTTAGTYGVWYYSNDSKKVPHATLSSFKRASTWSLGSLAFGSLVLAILDIIRALINILSQQAAQDGDMIGVVVGCIASCLIATIDWLIEFFNRLAYVNIALYGNGYIGAAKETWRLVKQKGVDALIQDSLVNTVFGIGSFVIAILCGITVYAYLTVVNPTYVRNDSNYFSVVILYA
ncbi:duf580-domain-containing protein [Ceraceosorus bombacis]|uniref:Protein PNS1 n=1 Tax=Ceraceosorus bombacis TaxID=401625 RepID=A0A0P1BBV4_9BASI|nr:duf580-domain-containing protein [Ceraceosorus bombacis]